MDLGFTAIPCNTVLCYVAAEIFKSVDAKDEDKKYLPVITGCLGLVLGIVAFITTPTVISAANDVFTAAAIGAVSGFASTGINQVYKQFSKAAAADIVEDVTEAATTSTTDKK